MTGLLTGEGTDSVECVKKNEVTRQVWQARHILVTIEGTRVSDNREGSGSNKWGESE